MAKITTTFNGIMVFEILPDGCLNGVYSNDAPKTKNQIFNVIARRITPENKEDKVIGTYKCAFIDLDNKTWDCYLTSVRRI